MKHILTEILICKRVGTDITEFANIAKSLDYKMFEYNGGVFSTQEVLSLGYPETKPLFKLEQVI